MFRSCVPSSDNWKVQNCPNNYDLYRKSNSTFSVCTSLNASKKIPNENVARVRESSIEESFSWSLAQCSDNPIIRNCAKILIFPETQDLLFHPEKHVWFFCQDLKLKFYLQKRILFLGLNGLFPCGGIVIRPKMLLGAINFEIFSFPNSYLSVTKYFISSIVFNWHFPVVADFRIEFFDNFFYSHWKLDGSRVLWKLLRVLTSFRKLLIKDGGWFFWFLVSGSQRTIYCYW